MSGGPRRPDYPPDENPLPNLPPVPGDHLPSRVVTASGALRRSMLVWGWGQLAAGDRRGWLGPPLQVGAVVAVVVAVPYASGTAAPSVFLVLALVGVMWVAIAAHAWRRAARRRASLGGDPGGGGRDLLWLAPIAVAAGAGFWLVAGDAADPALTLAGYLDDWSDGRVEAGAARFTAAPAAGDLAAAWERQRSALRNEIVRVLASNPTADVDPDRPFDGLRWLDLGRTVEGSQLFEVVAARNETVRDQLFGLLPTTSRRLVTIERLGGAELRPVAVGHGLIGPIVAWRVVRFEMAGESITSR